MISTLMHRFPSQPSSWSDQGGFGSNRAITECDCKEPWLRHTAEPDESVFTVRKTVNEVDQEMYSSVSERGLDPVFR